jgi:hypothetical protein
MAQNYSELIFLIPWFILLLIAVSMVIQGWMITHESHGYRENPKFKGHPEMKGVRKGDGLMVVNFDRMPDDDYNDLYDRIQRLKMEELFEEPSAYEDEDDDI